MPSPLASGRALEGAHPRRQISRCRKEMGVLHLFPENGLDRSLHAPVFIGLMFLVFFRETLGWGFAGLVVPGYLATVMIAAPVTGVLVVVEAVLTYIVALLLGRILPRTGAWFTFFGRERFLLLIASASLVRLAIEGSVLPAITARSHLIHSRELYSLGLVLVPLLANSFTCASRLICGIFALSFCSL